MIVSVVLFIVTLFAGTVFASNDYIKIIVNKQEIESEIAPQIVNGTAMVPLKVIAEGLGADVKWEKQSNAVIITTKEEISKTVATIPKEGVILSAVERKGMYEDFTLEVKGCKRYVDWENVSNDTYAPKLLLSDINHDKQKELIIILTTGTGTEVHVTEAHVINLETLIETYIDNPKAIILKNVKTKIMENEVEMTIGDQKTLISIDNLSIKQENLFSNSEADIFELKKQIEAKKLKLGIHFPLRSGVLPYRDPLFLALDVDTRMQAFKAIEEELKYGEFICCLNIWAKI